jgi:hypothetical protein
VAMRVQKGRAPYTPRGFRQDAQEAMSGDIVRGLIEAITNSDDSYEKSGASSGKIWIGVDHSRKGPTWDVIVRDKAAGLTRDEMLNKLLPIGARTSGFEKGLAVRGNRGRGAMDLAAFGEVTFESIKGGEYTFLKVQPTGDYEINERTIKVTPEIRGKLHIRRGNGTVVTIHCLRTYSCPRHGNLVDDLRDDFQLRDIMADPRREVLLAKLNDAASVPTRLRYEVDPNLEVLFDDVVAVPDYDVACRMKLVKLRERSDAPAADCTRKCGVLIAGRRAIYENSLFRFEGSPHAGWLAGRIDCGYLDDLAFQYDELEQKGEHPSPANPIPIISRRRRGLAAEHPFVKLLRSAIEAKLQPIIEMLEKEDRERTGRTESAETRRVLDRVGREAAKLLQQSLREIEEDDEPVVGPGALPILSIIPSAAYLHVGENKTLSVICDVDAVESHDKVEIEIEPEGIVEAIDGLAIGLQPHRMRNDALSGRVRLRGLQVGEAILTASVGNHTEAALVKCALPPPQPPPPEPPTELAFERLRYKIGFGKTKRVELHAPADLVELHGRRLKLRSTSPGVVLRQSTATMVLDEQAGFCIAGVSVEGRALGAQGHLIAELDGLTAGCEVTVKERDDGGPDLQIDFSFEEPGTYRAYLSPPNPKPGDPQTLYILVKHPTVSLVLGSELQNESNNEWKLLLAEVVTDVLVRRLLTRKYPPSIDVDAQSLYADHAEWVTKLLPRLQRSCLAGATSVGEAKQP